MHLEIKKMASILLFVSTQFLFVACGSDRAGGSVEDSNKTVAGVVERIDTDRDGDGISNEDEINIYGTNPDNNDTDGDGLNDKDELFLYDTNVSNPDTDGDGLSDGEEIYIYDTNASNEDSDNDALSDFDELRRYFTNPLEADTDGDCLLDSFEILNYETNATNVDTDGDQVNDGIEIYSTAPNDFNISCLENPETLENGFNLTPAMDAIPDRLHDVIDALDPTNDSDGDGQSNLYENNCTEGDPLDNTKLCLFIMETEEGNLLSEHGYAYIPGGFDVDGDGYNEGGFWMSRYQARSSGVLIPSEMVIEKVGNINQYISKNFKVLNRDIEVTSYNEAFLSETNTVGGSELVFDEESIAGIDRVSGITPYLALVELENYQLTDKNGTLVDVNVTLPTLKQYVHVQMLLKADLENNGDGRHIRNGLLAVDSNVPLLSYSLIIDEFGVRHKEYLRNLVQLRETNTEEIVASFSLEDLKTSSSEWWRIDINAVTIPNGGALSSVAIAPYTAGLNSDPYAVLVRGGKTMDFSYGIAGVEGDTTTNPTKGIGFRAATDYLY